jgi:hypothetical protein
LNFRDRIEAVLREPLVSYRSIKSLNVSVLLRLSGWIYSIGIPFPLTHSMSVALMYSGPLSQRKTFGFPRYSMI